ncbi:MAG: hypothetical protein KAG28_03930 [Cocleimonas sp.]|nr:hypothetical protein [Cocleimonas sp.]
MWLLRWGLEWRILPPELGKGSSVFKRYSRGCALGASDINIFLLIVPSTVLMLVKQATKKTQQNRKH